MKRIIIMLSFAVLPAFYSCRQKAENDDPKQEESYDNPEDANPEEVELSAEQLENAGITMGKPVKKPMQKEISVNGNIRLLPNYQASVTPFASGYVERIYYREGDHVQKGAVLASLKHPDYIQLQQDYLEADSRFEYLKKELERQKTLSEANVSAQKQYQQTMADYEAAKAKYFATSEKLKFLGISPEAVQTGNIQNTIYLRAPISGNISQLNIHKGELVDPNKIAFELADNNHLYVRLLVFENDINQIHKGESFTFSVPAFADTSIYHGKITGIDGILDPETKTMEVTGESADTKELVPGLYIEARIQSWEEEVYTLPFEAVVRDQDAEYIFIYQGKQHEKSGEVSSVFKKTKITTGVRQAGFIQVLKPDSLINNENIVQSGAFYLKAEMNKGEGDQD